MEAYCIIIGSLNSLILWALKEDPGPCPDRQVIPLPLGQKLASPTHKTGANLRHESISIIDQGYTTPIQSAISGTDRVITLAHASISKRGDTQTPDNNQDDGVSEQSGSGVRSDPSYLGQAV